MSEQLLRDLRSVDPARRRAAIIALVQANEISATNALFHVATTDPDPAIRDLADKGAQRLQKHQWQIAASENPDSAPAPAKNMIVPESAEHRIAHTHLRNAFDYKVNEDRQNALVELAHAFQIDPAIKSDSSARGLAAELMNMPAPEAIAAILAEDEEGDLKPRRKPLLTGLSAKVLLIIGAELVLMAGLFDVFTAVWGTKLLSLSNSSRVAISGINGPHLLKDLPTALMLLGLILFSTVMMQVVGGFFGGTGTLIHFLSVMLGVEALAIFIAVLVLIFLPIATYTDLGGGAVALRINPPLIALGFAANLFWQAAFVSRTHKISLPYGGIVVGCGLIIAAVVGVGFGIFARLGFG